MEAKMKKIPFDLERAKKGEAFYSSSENKMTYVSDYKIWIVYSFFSNETEYVTNCKISDLHDCYHLIPDEPKPERWAVVVVKEEWNNRIDAIAAAKSNNKIFETDKFKVVKLADDE